MKVIGTQFCEYTKSHWIAHFKNMNCVRIMFQLKKTKNKSLRAYIVPLALYLP